MQGFEGGLHKALLHTGVGIGGMRDPDIDAESRSHAPDL